MSRRFLIKPGGSVSLSDHDPGDTAGWRRGDDLDMALRQSLSRIDDLQYLLYAEHRRALLIVLQAMDVGARTVSSVMSCPASIRRAAR